MVIFSIILTTVVVVDDDTVRYFRVSIQKVTLMVGSSAANPWSRTVPTKSGVSMDTTSSLLQFFSSLSSNARMCFGCAGIAQNVRHRELFVYFYTSWIKSGLDRTRNPVHSIDVSYVMCGYKHVAKGCISHLTSPPPKKRCIFSWAASKYRKPSFVEFILVEESQHHLEGANTRK